MSADMLPYGRHHITDDDVEAVVRVLRSQALTQGGEVPAFEAELAALLGSPFAVAVSNGTAALEVAYRALGLGPGDEVITSPITFVATANAARRCGAEVVFADVDAEGNLSAESVLEHIGPRTRGIVAVHFAGLPCDLASLKRLAQVHNLWIVEDAAHALGATYQGVPIGSGEFGELTTFSFHPVKHITCGEGGAITSRSESLTRDMKRLREHGLERIPYPGSDGQFGYAQEVLGDNFRMSDIHAALGRSQLRRLRANVARRRQLAERYRAELGRAGLDAVQALAEPLGRESSYHLFPVLIDFAQVRKSRGQVMRELRERGIGTQVHYIPVCDQPYFARRAESRCPRARRFFEQELSLPMFPELTDADVTRVVESLVEVIRPALARAG
jgi:perosamine synthetase